MWRLLTGHRIILPGQDLNKVNIKQQLAMNNEFLNPIDKTKPRCHTVVSCGKKDGM